MIAKRQDSVVIPPSRVAFLFFFFKRDYTHILSIAVSFAIISLLKKKTLRVALENYEVYNRAKLSRNNNYCTNCRPNWNGAAQKAPPQGTLSLSRVYQ